MGDVGFGIKPEFSGEYERQMTSGEYSIGLIKGLFICCSNGIKKGIELERNIGLVDIVPTICYLLDMSVPSTCEGAVIYQLLENLRKIGNRYKDEKARKFALKTYIKFLIIGVDNLWKEMEEKIK